MQEQNRKTAQTISFLFRQMIEQRQLLEGVIPATGGYGAAPDNSLVPPLAEEFEHLKAGNSDRPGGVGQGTTSCNGAQNGDNDNYPGKPDHIRNAG